MNRNRYPTDELVRRLPLMNDAQARLMSDDNAKEELFQKIVQLPPQYVTPSATRRGGTTPRRSVLVAAILAGLTLATIGGAAAYLSSSSGTSTAVACHTGLGGVAIIDAVTGDPVLDCEVAWRRQTGEEPPALAAYDNGTGGIEVLPVEREVPAEWQRLERGVRQNPKLLELKAALEDHGDGLMSKCYMLDAARSIVEGELDRLGFTGWAVEAERGEADGASTCTFFYLEEQGRRVVLVPIEGLVAAGETPYQRFAQALNQHLAKECLTTHAAADLARRLATQEGIPELVINEVSSPSDACTRADVTVGGIVTVTLRGPSVSSDSRVGLMPAAS